MAEFLHTLFAYAFVFSAIAAVLLLGVCVCVAPFFVAALNLFHMYTDEHDTPLHRCSSPNCPYDCGV
ncbi:MAG: hypothetical protein LBI31_00220, partial [Zoogloeaceae bacterium]|nr:hypothetical protein [Zoogloeaceae bacterium]